MAQLTPNVRILIDFELPRKHLIITPTVDVFHRFYTLKKKGYEDGWFYVGACQYARALVVDSFTFIKERKHSFFFVPTFYFLAGF